MDMPIDTESRWKAKHDPINEFRAFLREWLDMYFQDTPTKGEVRNSHSRFEASIRSNHFVCILKQRNLHTQAKDLIMTDLRGRGSVEPILRDYDREVRNKSKDIRIKHPDQYFRRQRELYVYKVLRDLHKDMYNKEFSSLIDRDGDYLMPYIYDIERYRIKNKGVY